MATLASIQNKLLVKVFEPIGSDLTVNTLTSTSTSKWGDKEFSSSSTVIKAVPYNQTFQGRNITNPFGEVREGQFDMVIPHTSVIKVGDTVTFDGATLDVIEVEKFPYADGNIAFLIRVVEKLD